MLALRARRGLASRFRITATILGPKGVFIAGPFRPRLPRYLARSSGARHRLTGTFRPRATETPSLKGLVLISGVLKEPPMDSSPDFSQQSRGAAAHLGGWVPRARPSALGVHAHRRTRHVYSSTIIKKWNHSQYPKNKGVRGSSGCALHAPDVRDLRRRRRRHGTGWRSFRPS